MSNDALSLLPLSFSSRCARVCVRVCEQQRLPSLTMAIFTAPTFPVVDKAPGFKTTGALAGTEREREERMERR